MNESAKKRALNMLDKRDYSCKELTERLIQKGESPEDAEAAVERFAQLGLLNDEKYAGLVVRHYAAKGYGASRVKTELFRRGVPKELWDEALEQMPGQEDAMDAFLRRRLKDNAGEKEIRRATDALLRRGFSWEEIRSALNRYRSDSDC
ncbi:MAG: regulatory protein RecX [Candidatus Heteroscillospira sp.]|jgi:regulatory protein